MVCCTARRASSHSSIFFAFRLLYLQAEILFQCAGANCMVNYVDVRGNRLCKHRAIVCQRTLQLNLYIFLHKSVVIFVLNSFLYGKYHRDANENFIYMMLDVQTDYLVEENLFNYACTVISRNNN